MVLKSICRGSAAAGSDKAKVTSRSRRTSARREAQGIQRSLGRVRRSQAISTVWSGETSAAKRLRSTIGLSIAIEAVAMPSINVGKPTKCGAQVNFEI